MREVHLAELRDSWTAWLGVSTAFVVTHVALALSVLVLVAGVHRRAPGGDQETWLPYVVNGGFNLAVCALVAGAVIGTATGLVVDSRRGSLARLALGGATPGQVVATVMSQLTSVTLACALVGDLVAVALLRPVLGYLASERGQAAPDPVYAVWPLLLTAAFGIGLALVGGLRQALRASRIAPVEALRQASGGRVDRMTWGRWLRAAICLGLLVVAFRSIPAFAEHRSANTMSYLAQTSVGVLVVTAALLSALSPLLVGPVTRAWTRLVPSPDPAWELARSTTVAKGARLTKSVVPVMMTIGLLFGMLAIVASIQSSLYANGVRERLEGTGPVAMLVIMGLPLAIAVAGGVGSLVMMARQRDAELALSGIVGTTPAQRVAMPVIEGVMIAVTGALLSVVMVATAVLFLSRAFPATGLAFAFTPDWVSFAVAFLVTASVMVAAALLPTLPALRRPEPRVIARLVAE